MKLYYEHTYDLTSGYFDYNRHLRPYGYFDLFQDLASKHAGVLNIDFDALFPKGIIWVLARTKYEVIKKDKGHVYLGCTWPHVSSRFDMVRDYMLKNENNEVVALGSSVWCLVDYKSGRLIPSSNASIDGEFLTESVFQNKLEKITFDESKLVDYGMHTVLLSDLDWNGHMNNARYSELVFNLLTKEDANKLISMELNYLEQMFLEESMTLKGYRNENEIIVVGIKGEHYCFSAKCILE